MTAECLAECLRSQCLCIGLLSPVDSLGLCNERPVNNLVNNLVLFNGFLVYSVWMLHPVLKNLVMFVFCKW